MNPLHRRLSSTLDRVAGWVRTPDAARTRGVRPGRVRDERGSISVWLAGSAVGLIAVAGISTDLTGQVHTQQHAQDIAAQAARVGAERVDWGTVPGQTPGVDYAGAQGAAQQYLRDAGVTGTVTLVNGNSLRVTTRDTYNTTFLAIIGIGRLRVSGDATAQLIRTEGGLEQ